MADSISPTSTSACQISNEFSAGVTWRGLLGFFACVWLCSEARELALQQRDALAFGSGCATVTTQHVDRTQSAMLDAPTVPA